jgi:hypothetical protein
MQLTMPVMIKPGAGRPPRRVAFKAETMRAIKYTVRIAAAGRYGEPGFRPEHDEIRSGVIWSDGPEAGSFWVRDDQDGAMRAVKLPTAGQARKSPGILAYSLPSCPPWLAGARIARAEHVRREGVYRAENVIMEYGRVRNREIRYHSGDCPEADGLERQEARDYGYTIGAVVDVLIGRNESAHTGYFCRTCIYLSN